MHNNKPNPPDNARTDTINSNNQPIQNSISRNNPNNKTNSTHNKNIIQSVSNQFLTSPIHPTNKSKNQSRTSTNPPKHSLSPSQSPIKKKTKTLFVSTNRYATLEMDDQNETEQETLPYQDLPNSNTITNLPEKRISLPPPIIVKGVADFVSVRSELLDRVGPNSFTFKSTSNTLKIQSNSPDVYREIIHFLKDAKAEYHTYQMQENKAFRIVIRNLHPTTNTSEIKSAIEEVGFSVRQVSNVLHKITKSKLPLFFVDLEPAEINKNIFEINSLLHTKIKIEEPYKRHELIQCQNCQEYGHSKTYCAHPPRCVRCATQHPSSTCSKPRESPAKCVLCKGDHPANYKGCQVHKELQKLRHPNQKTNHTFQNHIQSNVNFQATAHAAQTFPSNFHHKTYANITANHEPPPIPNTNQIDTGTMLTNFINEFKAIINPLLSILTTVLNKLILQNDK